MIKRILVPTDGSDAAMQGVRYAVGLARLLNAEVLGLYVLDVRLLEGPFLRDLSASLGTAPFVNYQNNITMILEERGRITLNLLAEHCDEAGVSCETVQVTGIIHQCIMEKSSLCDLVVMGRGGEHNAWLDGMMGSTSEAVLRRINMPVIITATDQLSTQHFVIAFDGSAEASHALKSGVTLCEAVKASLHVLLIGTSDSCKDAQQLAQEYMESHDISVEFAIRSGDVADEILAYAKDTKASLLIMGAYGHTRVREMILGSVTSQVLNHAPCPVLLQR